MALVTGSSRSIGASIVKRLAADGADVIVNYHRIAVEAEHTAYTINAGNGATRQPAVLCGKCVGGERKYLQVAIRLRARVMVTVEVMNGVSRPMLSSAFAWKVNSMYDQMTDTTVN